MKISRPLLLTSCCVTFMQIGCDKRHDDSSSKARPASDNASRSASLQQPSSNEPKPLNYFPPTPSSTMISAKETKEISKVTDEEISNIFLNSSGTAWNLALMEMEKRQTPVLVSVMVYNLDQIKGIAVVGGEAVHSPELRFPVARALIDCGEKPIGDLIKVCLLPRLGIRKRLLAARVLLQLHSSGYDGASVEKLRHHIKSSADQAIFNDLWAMAEDNTQIAAVFRDQ